MIELLNLPEEISYDDAYQLGLKLLNPRSLESETVMRLIGLICTDRDDDEDSARIPMAPDRGLFGAEIAFERFRKRNHIYCLQQCPMITGVPDVRYGMYRPCNTITISMMDLIEFHGRQAPHPDREVDVLRSIYNEMVPIETDHSFNALVTLMYNTFLVHAKLFGFVMHSSCVPYMEPQYSVNDKMVDFATFFTYMITEKYAAEKAGKIDFIAVECGNDEKFIGAKWTDPKEASDRYPLTTLLNLAQHPTLAYDNITYPNVIVHDNYLSNVHILFNISSLKYVEESSPAKCCSGVIEVPSSSMVAQCQDHSTADEATSGCSDGCSHDQGSCECKKDKCRGTCKATVKSLIPRGKRGPIEARRKNYNKRKRPTE